MPQPMNAHNGEAPLIEIAPEEIVQVHQPPNNENQAPEPLVPEPAPEPVQQIQEQQQAPAHLIQAIQPIIAYQHKSCCSSSSTSISKPIQSTRALWKKQAISDATPYMYQPVQQQSVQYRQPMQYPQQMRPQQNSYQNSRPNYANKQNEPCKGCGNVRQVVAANGNQVAVLGKIDIVVTVGSTKFTQTVHVLDQLHHTLILGFDFMKNQGAFINFDDLTLEMNKPKMIIGSISIKAGLVRTIKAVTIPKRSEINIPVSVSRQTHDSTVLLEPLESYCPALKNLVVAKCLVNVQNGKACLRLLNPTHSDIQLKPHKEIAKVSQVNIDDIYPLDDNTKHISAVSTTNIKQKDTDLHFDLSNSCLTSDEKSELSNFLQKNRSAICNLFK
ncbi:unnamed protein product [Mytilus edulis]|uniref:Uncharacterized protein n=1 Tax=Mytilus edulis TaxID=6550 RepID=A0A8S3UZ93_MYTED|nr:unnamed protein product [Mytilus edulis]